MDVIFHLAGNANVPKSVEDPVMDLRSNVLGTVNVLEFARRTGAKKLVFPSSSSVYRPGTLLPIPETAAVQASSPYGAAKIACENYCRAYFQCYGLDTIVLRFFNVYGPGMQRWVIYDIVQKLVRDRNRLVLLGDGRQVREYLYVDDAVSALMLAAERGLAGEVYNAGTGEPITITDLAKEILDEMGMPGTPIEYTMQSWPGDIPAWYADTTKFGLLGFRPSTTRKEGLRRTIGQILESEGHPGL